MKRTVLLISLFAALASPTLGAETLRTFSWSQLKEQGALTQGTILPAAQDVAVEQLQIDNPGTAPATVELLAVDAPGITKATYALKGYVRCRDVQGEAYLEMWNHMPDGSKFFSRTMADHGPMARLSGTSDRRPFVLPAYLVETSDRPARLTFSVVLPGQGTVVLDSLELVQFEPREDPLAASQDAWWSGRSGGLTGGIIGAILGLTGAVVGILGAKRSAHRAALRIMAVTAAVGVLMILAGAVALGMKQPYGVWYPLILGGIIGTVVFGGLIPVVRRRQRQDEMRRMEAMDAS
ncbi:MAG: hypothetical protein JXL80_07140 [Planctomycetes bacterium]|nr:hypothetical protein [Planctomycetota bacterium]